MHTGPTNRRLLVFNCHEAWVYQLHTLDLAMDIVVGLKGRAISGWDTNLRPQPPNSRLLSLQAVLQAKEPYACIIAHNLTDLLDARLLDSPKILIIHSTLAGIAAEQRTQAPLDDIRRAVAQYAGLIGAHVVPVSRLKGNSWGIAGEPVPFFSDPDEYLPYVGDLACGLRVANQISSKRNFLRWDFHEAAFKGIPVQLTGRNDDMAGVRPAQDWNELKKILSHHRFFIHTADPRFEDGYNMATLEAMAAGLPVIGNRHPSSPIVHGASGFLSDDPCELHGCALLLLRDRELAAKMGREARKVVAERFSTQEFKKKMLGAIQVAQGLWNGRKHNTLARP